MEVNDKRHPNYDLKYNELKKNELPSGESLKDTINRVMPLWEKNIVPMILSGSKILIVAHGNSLRAIVKILDQLSDERVISLNIPTGLPLVYEFDNISCAIIKHSNPCGFGIGLNNLEAYKNAVSTDPISYFGGIVAFNKKIEVAEAKEMNKSFLECIVAPSFSDESIKVLKRKKNLRILKIN